MPIRQPSLSRDEIKEILAHKRWTISSLAWYWELSRETVSRIVNSDQRERHWDDAFRGLPKLSAAESRRIRTERLGPAPTRIPVRYGRSKNKAFFDLGSILIATHCIGSIANEGDDGQVLEVIRSGKKVEYKIRWPGGSDVFEQDEIAPLVADSGRIGFIRE